MYTPAAITATGLSINGYANIFADNLAQAQAICGSTIYLAPSEWFYQMLSVLSLKQADTEACLQMAYSNFAPLQAIGAAQDSLYKLNGISRLVSSFSTCPINLTGTAGTVLTNTLVGDPSGNQWALPTPITMGSGGTLTVTATCQTPGAITALPGTISLIPATAGLTSATNAVAATPGAPIEQDGAFRARQSISQALPSKTRLAATKAAIAALAPGVLYNVFDNPTGTTDAYGTPAHSLTCVVSGTPSLLAIATAIFSNCGIGCLTNGASPSVSGSSQSVNVTDPNTGDIAAIGFYSALPIPIYTALQIHALAGFTSATEAAIQAAVTAYLNSLQIGQAVTPSGIEGAALSVIPNLSQPLFSIPSGGVALALAPSPTATATIAMLFYQISQGTSSNCTISMV